MMKKILAFLLTLALTAGGTLSASANTIRGMGYVVIKDTVSVIVPTALDFTMDPYEIGKRGSIYSDEYLLANRGNSDVVLTFTSIDVIFANDTDFEPSAEPLDEDQISGIKTAYLVLEFGSEDIEPIVLTDSDREETVEIVLGASHKQNSEYQLSLNGDINSDPDKDWQSGDIQIEITYQLEAVREESDEEEDEESEESERSRSSDQTENEDTDEASREQDDDTAPAAGETATADTAASEKETAGEAASTDDNTGETATSEAATTDETSTTDETATSEADTTDETTSETTTAESTAATNDTGQEL